MSGIPGWNNPINANITPIFQDVANALRNTIGTESQFIPPQMANAINSIVPFSENPNSVYMEHPTEGLMDIKSFEPFSEEVLYKISKTIVDEMNICYINSVTTPANTDYITIGPKICEIHHLDLNNYNIPIQFAPHCNNLTNVSDMFDNSYYFNQPISFLNVPYLNNIANMFYTSEGCGFNQPLNFMNMFYTSEDYYVPVGNAANSFRGCFDFNSPINFNTYCDNSNLLGRAFKNTSNMFAECYSFNQPLYISSDIIYSKEQTYHGNINYDEYTGNHGEGDAIGCMTNMFRNCTSFNSPINFHIWEETTITSVGMTYPIRIDYMFADCYSFNQPIDFSNVSCYYLIGVFQNCNSLNRTPIFDNSLTRCFDNLFRGCNNLRSIQWTNMFLNTSSRWKDEFYRYNYSFNGMFADCSNFNCSVNINYIMNNIYQEYDYLYFNEMFYNCISLNSPLSILGDPYAYDYRRRSVLNTYMDYMFYNCTNLNQPVLMPTFNSNINLLSMNYMFYNCCNFRQSISFDCIINCNAINAFGECQNLLSIDFYRGLYVFNASHMFYNCTNLQYFNAGSFSTSYTIGSLTNASSMFEGCTNLLSFNKQYGIFSFRNVARMFKNCYKLNTLMPNIIGDAVINAANLFDGCYNLVLNTPFNFNANNITDISGMFADMGSNLPATINFYFCSNLVNTVGFISGKDPSKRVNIYVNTVNDGFEKFTQNTDYNSIFGYPISWTSLSNGVYNAAYNIYVYRL